jgi:hypothetical protein
VFAFIFPTVNTELVGVVDPHILVPVSASVVWFKVSD